MLALIFQSDPNVYYALDAQVLDDSLPDDLDVPADANTVHYHAGAEPSEALLLLPFSTIKKLKQLPADTDDLERGNVYYDRTILIYLNYTPTVADPNNREVCHHSAQEWSWGVPNRAVYTNGVGWLFAEPAIGSPFIRTSGWFFISSEAVDPRRDPEDDDAVHLARFVDLRGIQEFIGGNPGFNLNVVDSDGPYHDDYEGASPLPYPQYTWQQATDYLWRLVARPHYEKYDDTPAGFDYPEFDPGNPHPHNLEFQLLSAWEAFVAYVHLISHEIFPNIDGTFRVAPIHTHTYVRESSGVLIETDLLPSDPEFDLKLRLGPNLSQLVNHLQYVSNEAGPPLIPYSFVGVFTRSPADGENVVYKPIYFYRSSYNQSIAPDSHIHDQQTADSLFVQVLLEDENFIPDSFRARHPFILDTMGSEEADFHNDSDGRQHEPFEDLHDHYIDMTFLWIANNFGDYPQTVEEDIRRGGDGAWLRSGGRDFYGGVLPGPPESSFTTMTKIGQMVAKWHLRTMMFGDFGEVTIHGWHSYLHAPGVYRPYMPDTRYQDVAYIMDPDHGPMLSFQGKYDRRGPYRRTPVRRPVAFAGERHCLAVVVAVAPAAATPTGDTGDFADFEQTTSAGEALLLTDDMSIWRPVDADDNEIDLADLKFTFQHCRDDAEIILGAIIEVFYINGEPVIGYPPFEGLIFGQTISAVDYLKGVPEGTAEPEDLVLTKVYVDGEVIWAPGGGGTGTEGPPGPPGPPGTPGPTYTEGYCIELDTLAIHHDAITNAAGIPAVGFTSTDRQHWMHPVGAATRTDAQWLTSNWIIRGQVVGDVGPVADALFNIDNVVPLMGGDDPTNGNAATTIAVRNIQQEALENDTPVTAIYNIMEAEWELLLVERYRLVRGLAYTAVAPDDETFEIDTIQALSSGLDPREDVADATETLVIHNVFHNSYAEDELVFAVYNVVEDRWEALPKGEVASYAGFSPDTILEGSSAVPVDGEGTVFQILAASVVNLGTKVLRNTMDHKVKGELSLTKIDNDTYLIVGYDLRQVLALLEDFGGRKYLGTPEGGSSPDDIKWLPTAVCGEIPIP